MGLVPPNLRAERVKSGKALSDWAKRMGVNSITCHIGFIPDDENDPIYPGFIDTMRDFGEYCAKNDQIFCFEPVRNSQARSSGRSAISEREHVREPRSGESHPLRKIESAGTRRDLPRVRTRAYAKDESGRIAMSHSVRTALGGRCREFRAADPAAQSEGLHRAALPSDREISGPQQRVDILKGDETPRTDALTECSARF